LGDALGQQRIAGIRERSVAVRREAWRAQRRLVGEVRVADDGLVRKVVVVVVVGDVIAVGVLVMWVKVR
jgi:hypothetical protein